MADMARQTRLAEPAPIFRDPLRIDQLLTQLHQSEPGAAPCLDVVANHMNNVGDRDRLAGRRVEMGGHPLQQHERMVVDQDDLAARACEARSLGIERSKVGEVTGSKRGDDDIIAVAAVMPLQSTDTSERNSGRSSRSSMVVS